MPFATFPATLFDYNGVLVDDETVHLAAFQDALRPLGIELSEADYWERYLGFDDVGAFGAILSDAGRSPAAAEIAELVEAKRPLYLARAEAGLRTFPGAAELLKRRAAAGPVGIVSGALRDEIELGLKVLGAREFVSTIISAEEARASKPDPQGYLMGIAFVAQHIGEELARRAVVIEDSVAGVQSAKSAGLACIAVMHSYPRAELEQAGADVVIEKVIQIDDVLLSDLYQKLHG